MFILDTNVIAELRKGRNGRADANVIEWAGSVLAENQYLSVITVLELEKGVLIVRRRDSRQGALLRAWLDNQVIPAFGSRIIPIDTAIAQRCAALHVPDPQSERDTLIAVSALVHGMTVVTRNTQDFVATGVLTLNPWQA